MNRILPVIFAVILVVLIAASAMSGSKTRASASTAEATLQNFYGHIKSRNMDAAYAMISAKSDLDKGVFVRDAAGSNGSLKTFSTLQNVDTHVLRETDSEADIRADLTWSTAVGAIREARDLKLAREDGTWKVLWTAVPEPKVPPQVVPVNYLRWDIIQRGADEDFGAQNVEAPRVRIVSMNAIERDGSVIILGEIVNEDTVPGFVTVNAVLVGKDGKTLGEESSFDKVSHTLLPKEVSPFRIDFPRTKLADVKNVRMNPTTLLVPASADPVIGVLNQRLEKDSRGHSVLRGELINQSGTTVNIPHVLATYYDNSGKVIWVSDSYVDRALVPQTPIPFSVEVRDELVPNVHTYRVTVNHYSINRS